MASGQTVKLPAVNKEIIEIKKRIQLSEGQRKALFEEIETQRKRDADEILQLKKEISKLVVSLHDAKTRALKTRMPVSALRGIIGHVGDKTPEEVIQILDLQIIDKTKQLDLLKYKLKQKELVLTNQAAEYQKILSNQEGQKVEKIEKRLRKETCEMQNKINAVEVQWKEAQHVNKKYKDIERSLQDDAARFESRIKQLEEELKTQQVEIDKLHKIYGEACKLRQKSRNALLQEEKSVVELGNSREQQALEGKRLLEERKRDLEKLERKFYQGKPQIRNEQDEDSPKDADSASPSEDPMESLLHDFEILKEATGGTSIEDVLSKFQAQKTTHDRLAQLRATAEEEKKKLEEAQDNYITELERLKFVETKDMEENAEEMEAIKEEIRQETERKRIIDEEIKDIQNTSDTILQKLKFIYQAFRPNDPVNDSITIVNSLNKIIEDSIVKEEKSLNEQMEELDLQDEKWLPLPYIGLARRTPLPQHGSPTPVPPPGTDDEEEVPSRGFLKRQAQLVVDAKTKRKNMRFQLPKTR